MIETWKNIKYFKGWYSVSNLGRVRKDKTTNNIILNKYKILEIKRRFIKNKTVHRILAKEYGVCRQTISYILSGKIGGDLNGRGRKDHFVKQYLNPKGYFKVDLYKKSKKSNKRRNVSVHTLVTEAFLGKRPKHLNVNHKDGIKTNNYISNLEYVTPMENVHHAIRLGLWKKRKNV